MNQRIIQDDDIRNMIDQMRNAKFNDMNPLVQNIKNHVDFESSIAREVPQVQNKIDILTQDDTPNPSMSKLLAASQNNIIQPISNNNSSSSSSGNINITPEDKVNNQQYYISIAKMCILTIAIIGVICWLVYVYIPVPYNYTVICITCAAGIASDYFYCNKCILL